MTVVGQVEIDPWCRKVLAKHWPEVPRHDDVRTAVEWWADRRAPDLVAGGFPCQPVSQAGKKLAQADERWLWPAFADVVRELRPRYVLVENVPGLLGRGMGDVLGDLAARGYDAEWDCVPAAAVGAPHIRDRVWIVAYPASQDDGSGDARACQRPAQQPRGRRGPADLADAEGQCGELRATAGERPGRLAGSRLAVADAAGEGSPDGRGAPGGRPSPPRWMEPERLGWWATEPDVGRVAHGVPRRVDRLRGLGNAVVPQVAEHVGRLIMTAAAA
jgi:DNA (cytosine-5)-methyltransferase 1